MRRTAAVVLVAALAACGPPASGLTVDLETDLAPGSEFDAVRTTVGTTTLAHLVTLGADYTSGVRVADMTVPDGEIDVHVELLSAGVPVDERVVRVTVHARYALTVVVTRSCRNVHCPGAGDPAVETTCAAGRCVDPRCAGTGAATCPPPECVADADCHAPAACDVATCKEGACFAVPSDARCPGGRCDAVRGCIATAPPDAGARDAGGDAGPCGGSCGGGPGAACCGGMCTNFWNDDSNCGACGMACLAGLHCSVDVPTLRAACANCVQTGCAVVPGGTCCPDVVGCVQSRSDRLHCGSCYTFCGDSQTCVNGVCM